MNPTSDVNLTGFLESSRIVGSYLLTVGTLRPAESEPTLIEEYGIQKPEIHIREAWAIGEGDLDSPGVLATDTPVIPSGVVDAPVLELIAKKQASKRD